MAKAQIYEAGAQITNEDVLNDPMLESQDSLESYVLWKVREWEDFVEANYYAQWDEFYRLWRGLWAAEDRTRETERSRIVTPALQQAVETSVSEVEEATFGHGKLFGIEDDYRDQEKADVMQLRQLLTEDFKKARVRSAAVEVLVNAAVYGTGVGEICLEEIEDMAPSTEPIMGGQLEAVGTRTKPKTLVKLKPVQMKNFRIDPVATCIEEAHGCAVQEFVPAHYVQNLQEKGIYKDAYVGSAAQDEDLEPNPELDTVPYHDKVQLIKYYGLVPRHLLEKANMTPEEIAEDEVIVQLTEPDESSESYWVEAVVVIANEGVVLKAEESPYMMKDRPIVAFQWDVVPGLFWGRGVCEKGYNSQKALDAEIRARIDALALTIHPMLAMDATRIPRGHVPQVRPGKMLLTNGNPKETLYEFNFGSVDQITFNQAAELQNMLQQATGAVDGAQMAQAIGSNNKTGAVSMALGPLMKRHKRTLVNFQENFWIPFVSKAAWRYMQFDPENYPVNDYKFCPYSTMGTMGREYEVSQLVQLMQTVGDQSPLHATIVSAVVEHMDLENREQLIMQLQEASKPDPQQEQMAMEAHQKQMALQDAQIGAVQGQANESNARAEKYKVEAQLEPQKVKADMMDAVADVRDGVTTREFEQRLKIAETRLKERELNIREKEVDNKRKKDKEDKEAQSALRNAMGSSS